MGIARNTKTAQEVERIFEASPAADELLRCAGAMAPAMSDDDLLYAFLVGSVKLATRKCLGETKGEGARRLFDLLMLVYVEVNH